MDTHDDFDTQRASAPVGSIVEGTVAWVPSAGVIGVGVDLDLPALGFVDVVRLPTDPADWPSVGCRSTFEVVQHRPGQIRLEPMDPALRRAPTGDRYPTAEWNEIKRRYPVGSTVEMKVIRTFNSNRECSVTDGFLRETVEWSGRAPTEGARRNYRVERHRDTTQRVILVPSSAA